MSEAILTNRIAQSEPIDYSTQFPNRSELTSVVTGVAEDVAANLYRLQLTTYNASTKSVANSYTNLGMASTSLPGIMPKETYAAVQTLLDDVADLKNQGGKFIGVSFATKADLEAYSVPVTVNVGDFTYVLDDEAHADATTRWIYDGVKGTTTADQTTSGFAFAYVINYDPVGIATTLDTGLVKSVTDIAGNAGKIFVETDGTMSVLGWDTLNAGINGKAPTSHAVDANTYGLGTDGVFGHVKLSAATNSTNGVGNGIAATPSAVKTAYDLANTANTTAETKAPIDHASASTTYGLGNEAVYGHLKLSNATNGTEDTSFGVAATPAAVKAAYDLANGKADINLSNVSNSDFLSKANAAGAGGTIEGIRAFQTLSPTSGTVTVNIADSNFTSGNIFKITPAGNVTFTMSNATLTGDTIKTFEIHIVMGSTLRTMTWWSGLTWINGVPTLVINKTNVMVFRMTSARVYQGDLAYTY